MGYGNFSRAEVIISYEAKLNGKNKTEMRDKFHIPWLVVRQSFDSTEGQVRVDT